MPYIGKSPVTGNYNSLDDMSGSFNSSTTTFNLLVNSGTALTPVRAEALIISINGVIQEPGADFTVSAATITYTTAPASTDSFFGVVLGQQLDIATPGDGTVSTAKIADGAVNMAKLGSALTDIADGTVTSPTIANSGDTNTGLYWPAADTLGVTAGGTEKFRFGSNPIPGGNKNLLINGAMRVFQRSSDTLTGLGAASAYLLDRWRIEWNGGSASRYTLSQESSGGVSGKDKWMKLLVTTPDTSPTGSEYQTVQQDIEAQNCLGLLDSSGDFKPFTVSFDVLINGDGTGVAASNPKLACFILNADGNRHYVKDVVVASGQAAAWERVSFTVPADTTAYVNNDNGKGVTFGCTLIAGSSDNTTDETWGTGTGGDHSTSSSANIGYANGNYLGITNTQVEVGSVATDFAHEDIGTTLNKCKRYYERITPTGNGQPLGSGFAQSATAAQVTLLYLEKRAIPTITGTAAGTFTIVHTGGVNAGTGSLSWDQTGTTSCRMNLAYGGSMTDGQGLQISRDATDTTFIEISAEI